MGKYPQEWLDEIHPNIVTTLARDDDAIDDQGNSFSSRNLLEIGRHDLLGIVEAALRLREQRDRAWITLSKIEEGLGKLDESGIAFLLAGATTVRDIDDWNALAEAVEAEGATRVFKELPLVKFDDDRKELPE